MERVYKREGILFKILPCLLIAMYAIMCLYGSTVCATDIVVDDNSYTLPTEISGKKYIVVYQRNVAGINYITVIASDDEFHYQPNFAYGQGAIISNTETKFKYLYVFSNDDLYKISDVSYYSDTLNVNGSFCDNSEQITCCNFDLKDNDGNVVFQGASQELATTIISTQITSVDFSQVLTEVLQILLIALPVVILVIALTKAISLLFQVLRNA